MRRPARASLPYRPTAAERAAAQRFATDDERAALRVTLLSLYAAGRITRGDLAAALVALGLAPLHC